MLVRRETPTVVDTTRTASTEPDTGLYAGRAGREATERRRRTLAAIPPSLTLDTTMIFAPARVVVVTFDADRRRLVVARGER